MGIVLRESFKSSIASYLGLAIGIINVVLLFTKYLSPEQLGLTRVLQESSLLLVMAAQLGSPYIILKFFPELLEKSNASSFFIFIIVYSLAGLIIFISLFYLLQSLFLDYYRDQSPLLVEYIWYVIPLVICFLYINIFEAYSVINFRVFYPTFVREVFLKLSNTLIIILFALKLIDFTWFLNLMVLSSFIAALVLLFYLIRRKFLLFSFPSAFLRFSSLKPMIGYGLYTLLGGIAFMMVTKIDTLMLPAFRGLKETAVYVIALLIASVMEIPKKNLAQAAIPVLTNALKDNDTGVMDDIYKRTSLNLLIIGSIIFVFIWLNVNDIFSLIPKGELYISGKIILLIFLFSRLIDLFSGISNEIILYSRLYKYTLIMISLLAFLTVSFNLIFIPLYGVTGAALAALTSVVIYLVSKFILIWKKFKVHPFRKISFKIIFLFIGFLLVAEFLNGNHFHLMLLSSSENPILLLARILIKSLIIVGFFIYLIYKMKISEDFNTLLNNIYKRIKTSVE